MELMEYIKIIKLRIWTIIGTTFLLSIISAVLSIFVIQPVYEGRTTLIIGRASSNGSDKLRYDDILMYQTLVKTYSELAKSKLVVNETIMRLGYTLTYDDMSQKLKVAQKGDTQILEIIVEDHSPIKAAQLANTLSHVFIEKIKEVMNYEDVKIMDESPIPIKPVKPNILLNILIAGFIGFISSITIICILEYLDNTLKTEEDVEHILGIPVLAAIPYVQNKRKLKKPL